MEVIYYKFLKLINNSSSWNKGNHNREGGLDNRSLIIIGFDDFTSLVFVLIEKIYQTLETVFHRLSKHLEFRPKYSAARRIFNSLLNVWISR